jgi:aspartate aminotransferase
MEEKRMSYVASSLSTVKPSASMTASLAAKALRATGVDVIDLGLGEPDFRTPAHIIDATYTAARAGETYYTAAAGTHALRQAVADKFRRENDLDFKPDDIVVANGAKQIIFNALMATLNHGDEVILPAPYFVSYPEMVKLLGGIPVIVDCPAEVDFRLTPEALEARITPRTKWLFLNMPNNPSGAVYTAAQLKELDAVLARHRHVLVLSDEIYEHIIFDNRTFVSFGRACPALKDRTLIVNGVAKAYAMTGWRIGYAAGPAPLVKAMNTVQSQSCTSVAAPMQAAALAALTGPQDCVDMFRTAYERRRNLVVAGVAAIEGLTLQSPGGAFYAYIGCQDLIGRTTPSGFALADDVAVSDYLLTNGHVGSVPGTAYGLSPFFRISTAAADEILSDAIARLARAVDALLSATIAA